MNSKQIMVIICLFVGCILLTWGIYGFGVHYNELQNSKEAHIQIEMGLPHGADILKKLESGE